MKKLALLSLASGLSFFLMAGNGLEGKFKPTTLVNHGGTHATGSYQNSNVPKIGRAGTLQKVKVGSAGNLLTALNANTHQLYADSVINTVVFIHRNDQTAPCCLGGNNNVGQYRYDWSKDGGNTFDLNVGVLNPLADNVTINGRYPQAMLEVDYTKPADSAYLVYDGTWHNGAALSIWQGHYWGSAQLGGPASTYTEYRDTVNSAKVEIFTNLVRGAAHTYWEVTRSYVQVSNTSQTVDGIVVAKGVYNPTTHYTTWTDTVISLSTGHFYDASNNQVGNALTNPSIAFDPTGQNGWILAQADLVDDDRYLLSPVLFHSTDGGVTWSSPITFDLDHLPGMFPNTVSTVNTAKTFMGDAQVTVDAAGNPHIAAIVGQADSTTPTFSFYTINTKNVLYDIYYNPAVAGCSWQANALATVFGYSGDYTVASGSDAIVNDNNRVQISRSDDGTKIFIFWNDSDSSDVVGITDPNNTNPSPNMFGVGIDMTTRKVTDIKNFTAGDSLIGGKTPTQAEGVLKGTHFNSIGYNTLNKTGGIFDIPAIATDIDYRAAVGNKSSGNPAQFYYLKNIEFAQADFINRFDNAPPTLTVGGNDTVYIQYGRPYVQPTATAFDCVAGSINPVFTTTVPRDGNNNTDSIGVFTSTWTATNPQGNTATHTQVVIVADVPIARITYTKLSGIRFQFVDSSLNMPTFRSWTFGDGQSNNLNQVRPSVHQYSGQSGSRMVVLTASNSFGSDKDTAFILVTVGINDPEFAKTVNVYPNPSNGVVTIDMPSDANDAASVTVFNSLGEVAGEPVAIKGSGAKTVLNLNYLQSGVYMLKVETASGKTALKQLSIVK